jgi:hypothetical protein
MAYDYSDAKPPRDFEVIPAGEIVTVSLHLRYGGAGEDGVLKRSKDGKCEMLDVEFTIIDGKWKGRKIWQFFVVDGTDPGHAQAADITNSTLKAIIDAAKGLMPDDISAEARAARTVSLKDFEGMCFMVKLGIEKGGAKKDSAGNLTGEHYADKNVLGSVITKDKKDWKPVEQAPPWNGGGTAPTTASNTLPVEKPKWAS